MDILTKVWVVLVGFAVLFGVLTLLSIILIVWGKHILKHSRLPEGERVRLESNISNARDEFIWYCGGTLALLIAIWICS